MPAPTAHPNKDIAKALKQAAKAGWTVTRRRGPAWGEISCGQGCRLAIWSTPSSPSNRAKQIAAAVRNCAHGSA